MCPHLTARSQMQIVYSPKYLYIEFFCIGIKRMRKRNKIEKKIKQKMSAFVQKQRERVKKREKCVDVRKCCECIKNRKRMIIKLNWIDFSLGDSPFPSKVAFLPTFEVNNVAVWTVKKRCVSNWVLPLVFVGVCLYVGSACLVASRRSQRRRR